MVSTKSSDCGSRVKDGACRFEGSLAGSVLTLDRAVRNMIQFVGAPPAEAIRMATLNTAQQLGIADRKGQLKEGADADLVILDENLNVSQVYARGLPRGAGPVRRHGCRRSPRLIGSAHYGQVRH